MEGLVGADVEPVRVSVAEGVVGDNVRGVSVPQAVLPRRRGEVLDTQGVEGMGV